MLEIPLVVLPSGDGLPIPTRATPGSAGFDLRAAIREPLTLQPGRRALVPCGVALAIPEGWEGQVRPRSGLAARHGVTVLNAPGTIDSDYRGEVKVPLVNLGEEPFVVTRGERIAQILFAPVPDARFVLVDALAEGARGDGGFGSTGRS
jgi:dUTP pyrophosphatase